MAAKEKQITESVSIEPLVEVAMRAKGWLLPTTEAAVAQLEAELLANPIDVPESLRSAGRVFEEISRPRARRAVRSAETSTATTANLALAARDGGQIPAEVRDMMNRDREETEREHALKHKVGKAL